MYFAIGLYLIAKDLEISSAFYTYSWMPPILMILRYLSYALIIFISLFLTRYTDKNFKRYFIFMISFFLISTIANSVTIFFDFMFIFAAKDIPINKKLKYVVAIQVVISLSLFLGTLAGVIADWTYQIAGRFRHSMGYGYPNAIPTVYFYMMLAVCCLMREKFKLWHLVVFEGLNYLLFYYTNTKTAFALTAIALVVLWAIKFRKRKLVPNTVNKLFYVHSVYLIAVFSILFCYFFDPTNMYMRTIDSFISNRLSMGHNALMINDLSLFGQKIQWYGFGGLGYTMTVLEGEYNHVDCTYVKILLDHGIVMLATAIAGYMLAANEELKKGNRFFCTALLFANLYAMIEPRYINISLNPFVWCLSSLIGTEVQLVITKRKNKEENQRCGKRPELIHV